MDDWCGTVRFRGLIAAIVLMVAFILLIAVAPVADVAGAAQVDSAAQIDSASRATPAALNLQAASAGQETDRGDKPNVVILATGGTIAGSAASETQAGYESGQVGVDALISAVPELVNLASISGEQVSNIGSQDMTDAVWLTLAHRINELLATDEVDGIVITHGTDTLEETSYFLNLVVESPKPVVLTAAMRPSTALEALGRAREKGVVCVRSTRVPTGAVGRNIEIDDDALGLVASGSLNPAKARVLLKLALLHTTDPAEIQEIFDLY